jgi:hypothetical protein
MRLRWLCDRQGYPHSGECGYDGVVAESRKSRGLTMAPKTTASADELTLFLTHGSGFPDHLDRPYSASWPILPSIEIPAAKPPGKKIVSARRLVLAGLAVMLFLMLVSSTKVATQDYETKVCAKAHLETCGTRVNFLPSPQDACRRAAGTGKLAFILHVSGYFEDPGFT